MRIRMWISLVPAVVIGLLLVAACGGAQPQRQEQPVQQEEPTAPEEVVKATVVAETEVVVTSTPTLTPTPAVLLPPGEEEKVKEIAEREGLSSGDLAREFTVLYALPDTGIAYLLTPRWQPPEIENSVEVLGALTVVQQLSDELPRDTYAMTLDLSSEMVRFIGAEFSAEFPAIIRTLPRPIATRPVALISSEQMCLTWQASQICALVSTPLREDLVDRLEQAVEGLGAERDRFALERAVPDVEGRNVLAVCAGALDQEPPAYAECTASVLSAPARTEDVPVPPGFESTGGIRVAAASVNAAGMAALQDSATGTGIGVLVVLTEVMDDVFEDVDFESPTTLKEGDYVMYDIVLPDDDFIDEEPQITESRVGLSLEVGADPEFYLPAIVGAPLIDEAEAATEPEAIISNLWICPPWRDGCTCCFKWRQCPDL